jgi:hypothetical protein
MEESYDLFLFEPNLKLWYQFTDYIFGTAGVYYRLTYSQDETALSSKELNRIGIRSTLNFGSFK